ncbi:MAG: glycine--tRNA ligase subunit alpha, partial [Alphaproteobacteria bacterium]|nr:glycine--tRNA ligase subunit alpha [Alphaproteobacteria bacterium]
MSLDHHTPPLSFQEMIAALGAFWSAHGCVLLSPYDAHVGAGTFHWATTLKALGPRAWRAAYPQPSRRPADGRYGLHPNRLQHYYQYQVLLKPAPADSQSLFLKSLEHIGVDLDNNDIRFIEDDWKSPTLAAAGLGWEVWLNGMEVSQFTYFQQVGDVRCRPVCTELTYGLERLAMSIQGVENVYDLVFHRAPGQPPIAYGEVFQAAEREFSEYHFDHANPEILRKHFDDAEAEASRLAKERLLLPAYDHCLTASHVFNQLDACGAISVGDRQSYIDRVAQVVKQVATQWADNEEAAYKQEQECGKGEGQECGKGEGQDQEQPSSGMIAEPEPHDLSAQWAKSAAEDARHFPGGVVDILIEFCSEELPATLQKAGANSLESLLQQQLAARGFGECTTWHAFTKHRIVVGASSVPIMVPESREVVRGPATTAPAPAIAGFLKRVGLDSVDQCPTVAGKKGALHYTAVLVTGGDALHVQIEGIIATIAREVRWPRSMRTADEDMIWARPLRRVTALYWRASESHKLGAEATDDTSGRSTPIRAFTGRLAVGGTRQFIRFDTTTRGLGVRGDDHPIALLPAIVAEQASAPSADQEELTTLRDFYAKALRSHGIELFEADRRASIERQLHEQDITIHPDPALMEEVCGLAESPVVRVEQFDPAFLELPPSVLLAVMRGHQKYFAVYDNAEPDPVFAPAFVAIAEGRPINANPQDAIVGSVAPDEAGKAAALQGEGFARVLKARLEDADFFLKQDAKQLFSSTTGRLRLAPSASSKAAMQTMHFNDHAGTLWDYMEKVAEAVTAFASLREQGQKELLREVVAVAKVDLVSATVGEFPELQG